MHEPDTPTPSALPCSTPHSAPLAWLRASPETDDAAQPTANAQADPPPVTEDQLAQLAALAVRDPCLLADAIARAAPDQVRSDGWSPFSRRLFLQVLAETGRVSLACDYTGLTRQSAYALRARDPVFAAGWDAACELARAPLADALYERAVEGVTETITRNGEVVAERHRHDSRLSIAVLHRLDKRCDRAEEQGARHRPLLHNWDAWLSLVGRGDDAAAAALLAAPGEGDTDGTPHCQTCQLRESGNPADGAADEPKSIDLSDRCWRAEYDERWMTDFPPPPGFDGFESRPFDEDSSENYERDCTAEEAAALDAVEAAEWQEEREYEERLRDAWFAMLRAREQEEQDRQEDEREGEEDAVIEAADLSDIEEDAADAAAADTAGRLPPAPPKPARRQPRKRSRAEASRGGP